MLERSHEYERMARVEETHWWYRSLHRLVLRALCGNNPRTDSRIIDAGCGTGGLMLFLRQNKYSNIEGFDLSEDSVKFCLERKLDVRLADLIGISDLYPKSNADAIIANDTLYFLNEAQRADFTDSCFDVLKPGGLLIANLPALRAFRGIHDISVGIPDRFTKSTAIAMFEPGQFDVIKAMYWPFILSPAIYFARLAQRRRMKSDPDHEIKSDIDLPSPLVNQMLANITSFENTCILLKPFGSSLFMVARKKG